MDDFWDGADVMVGVSFQPILGYGAGAPADPVTSLAFHDSATASGTGTLTVPATVQAGDIICVKENGSSVNAAPSGYTILANTAGIVLSYKIATGADASATVPSGSSLVAGTRRELLVFRGDVPANTVTGHDPAAINEATANPASQTVNASGGTPPLIVLASYNSTGAVDPRSFSPAKDAEVNTDTTSYFAYKIYNSSPADVTVDMDDEGSTNKLASGYIQVA